ncbi:MAG: hypothetical protein AB7V36_09240 [Bacteroidales bacterium]
MILLISENYDKSMFRISEWLKFYKAKHLIIFEDSHVKIKEVSFSEGEVEMEIDVDGEKILYSDITSYYWRRADGFFEWSEKLNIQMESNNAFYVDEYITLQNFFYFLLSRKKGIGRRLQSIRLNKLTALYIAKKVGFLVPPSMIIENKQQLQSFFLKSCKVFLKPMSDLRLFEKNGKTYTFDNKPYLNDSFLEGNEEFYNSLIQTYIEKKYELRVFVFKTKIYAMAIFSQRNKKTMYDFRDYSVLVPYTPYKLSTVVENQILHFMKEMDIDTGSIDFIVDNQGDLYFLEINPVGIFDMVSSPCKYHIEKDIAYFLTQEQ